MVERLLQQLGGGVVLAAQADGAGVQVVVGQVGHVGRRRLAHHPAQLAGGQAGANDGAVDGVVEVPKPCALPLRRRAGPRGRLDAALVQQAGKPVGRLGLEDSADRGHGSATLRNSMASPDCPMRSMIVLPAVVMHKKA